MKSNLKDYIKCMYHYDMISTEIIDKVALVQMIQIIKKGKKSIYNVKKF